MLSGIAQAKECAKRLECARLAGALARAKKREQARCTPNLSSSADEAKKVFWVLRSGQSLEI
jgi:hypothetical protein